MGGGGFGGGDPRMRGDPREQDGGRFGGGGGRDPREGRDPRSRDPRGVFDRSGGRPPMGQSAPPMKQELGGGGGAGPSGGGGGLPPGLPPHLAGADPEKAQLIMQVLKLTDEQIALLPADQRESIMHLKKQLHSTPQ